MTITITTVGLIGIILSVASLFIWNQALHGWDQDDRYGIGHLMYFTANLVTVLFVWLAIFAGAYLKQLGIAPENKGE